MAYSELIKSFGRIRDYMRQFYVYGFRTRGEYGAKSARSYDNERRRIESWLGGYMAFRQDAAGKRVFISVDSRAIAGNPLYSAFKAKSFTRGDITFHFCVLDALAEGKELSPGELADTLTDRYLSPFDGCPAVDDSTLRKKLMEYETLGLLTSEKRGRARVFRRAEDGGVRLEDWRDALAFFSEEHPLGVIGSFLLDRLPERPGYFGFKHHYILHALDSEVLCALLLAMEEGRCAELTVSVLRSPGEEKKHTVFPVKLYISTRLGRQYLLCYHYIYHKPMFFRLDGIRHAIPGAVERQPEKYGGWYGKFAENLWGVSTGGEYGLDHIEMTLGVEAGEDYILRRLEREKRCGRVTMPDEGTCVFTADVYDAMELLPWLRTFIGRIKKLECSDPRVTERFFADLAAMEALYGGDGHAVP